MVEACLITPLWKTQLWFAVELKISGGLPPQDLVSMTLGQMQQSVPHLVAWLISGNYTPIIIYM